MKIAHNLFLGSAAIASSLLLFLPMLNASDESMIGAPRQEVLNKSKTGNAAAASKKGPFLRHSSSAGSMKTDMHRALSAVWSQLGDDIEGEFANDYSGSAISLSDDGKTLAVGAPYNDGNGTTTNNDDSGHVKIYRWIDDEDDPALSYWLQLGDDIDGGEGAYDNFGKSVSLSSNGEILAVGAYGVGDGVDDDYRGKVKVFTYCKEAYQWTQLGDDIDGNAANDYFGMSVSLSSNGDTIAIGAPSMMSAGHVKVFKLVEDIQTLPVWTQLGDDIFGEFDYDASGSSVSLCDDGNTLAIGAPYNNGGNGTTWTGRGSARIYRWIEDDEDPTLSYWVQLGGDIDGEDNDYASQSVSLSSDGEKIAVGAYGSDSWTGRVRVFSYCKKSHTWLQIGDDIDGQAYNDAFGNSVSLSKNGETLAVGAQSGNDDNAGYVQVYRIEGNIGSASWVKIGNDIVGEAGYDYFGTAVSLSADGKTVAIGAPYNDSEDLMHIDIGHVRVFGLE